MTGSRYRLFLALTIAMPVLLLALLEAALRLTTDGLPLFVPAPFVGDGYLVANQEVARRYFPRDQFPPAPAAEPFAATKPANGLRVFVMGESSAAGFPLPHNGTFSRVLRDALTDVFPDRSVEVINLGIAATNSYALVDLMDEVLDRDPDMILVYAGHNEYYGAMGVASARGGLAPPVVKRLTLRLLRLRTVQLIRSALVRLTTGDAATPASGLQAATMMEVVARDRRITLGGDVYRGGLEQFRENLAVLVELCRDAGVELFVASQPSNVRDQKPFASSANARADSVFDVARSALDAGDTTSARELFREARDLDVIRFRAPGELDEVVKRMMASDGHYVAVAERFDSAGAGMPGSELFYEHVHPTPSGQLLIAQAFFQAMGEAGFGGHRPAMERLRPWSEYLERMALTDFDLREAQHTVATLLTRWPFVPVEEQRDYRGTYRPEGTLDSLALLVSRGAMPWGGAKLTLAESYGERGFPDSAAAEYRGLARDAPFAELPRRLLGRALLDAGDTALAVAELERAFELEPSVYAGTTLGRIAMGRRDPESARRYLEAAVRLDPTDPVTVYSLSLAYGMSRDLDRARSTADRLSALAPDFPGLREWRRTLGMSP